MTHSVAVASSSERRPRRAAAPRTGLGPRRGRRTAPGKSVREPRLSDAFPHRSMIRCASRATSRACVATVSTSGAPRSSPTVVIASTRPPWTAGPRRSPRPLPHARPPARRVAGSAAVSAAPAFASSGAPSASSASSRASVRARRSGRAVRSGVGMLGSPSMNANTAGSSDAIPLEHHRRPHDRGADPVLAVLGALALELVLDRVQRLLVEQRQVARDRVERVVGGDAVGERLADHPPDDLGDVRCVLRRPLGVEDLGARAVPAGRDRLLGEDDADVRLGLDRLRDRPSRPSVNRASAVSCSPRTWAIARGPRPGHSASIVPTSSVSLASVALSGTWTTSTGSTSGSPSAAEYAAQRSSNAARRLHRLAQQRRRERALLVGLVEADLVLDQTRRPDPLDVDGDVRVAGPVRDLAHRLREPLDRGGDAPHDRDRRVGPGLAVDEALTRSSCGRRRASCRGAPRRGPGRGPSCRRGSCCAGCPRTRTRARSCRSGPGGSTCDSFCVFRK